jgi:crotonobetainyl-CoA:carnitine CoA-transferase CaiB-like acyl-CoA transferase
LPGEFVEAEQRQALKRTLSDIFKTRTRDEWFDLLTRHDICVGKVYDLDETEHDPHLQARDMIVEVDHPEAGRVKQVGISVKLSDTPGQIRFLAAALGAHTQEVLTDLGLSQEKIAALRAAGAIR